MKYLLKLYFLMLCPILFSCKKYLDAKPDKSLQTPTTVGSVQGILDYNAYMNRRCEQISEISSDDYYLTDSLFTALSADRMRNAYLWQEHIFNGWDPSDWQNEYTVVYNANLVLESLSSIQRSESNAADWDNCKGQGLVFRAKSFFEIAQAWAKAYDSSSAATDLGIPLRLTSDYNTPTTRSSIEATYNQIIEDLQIAIPLLPDKPIFVYRPSKAAAYGLMARTFLVMGNYRQSGLYADSCLSINSSLVDYNTLNAAAAYPFSTIQYTNPEDIMHTNSTSGSTNISPTFGKIDTVLYNSYSNNDLRKTIFFKTNADGSHAFKGSYNASSSSASYNGIAVDEMYLIRAECSARMGNINAAMDALNTLLVKRWKNGTFSPYETTSATEALNDVLTERRKELVYRSLRFSDIKRLNRDGANIIMKRVIDGTAYTLEPNDKRYALPIPDNVIQASGIPQN